VRFFGLSEAGPATLRARASTFPCCAAKRILVVDAGAGTNRVYSLRELGIGSSPSVRLGRGFFGGAVPDPPSRGATSPQKAARFEGDNSSGP